MREIITTEAQAITNKINGEKDFTWTLNEGEGRYVVGCRNIFTGKTPSHQAGLRGDITELIGVNKYDSIGGWRDQKTGIYYVDANLHFNGLTAAFFFAELNGEEAIYDTKTEEVLYTSDFLETLRKRR